MTGITVLIALLAGVVSFASPCCLPLVPVYVSYLLGTTVAPNTSEESSSTGASLTGASSTGGAGVVIVDKTILAANRWLALRHALVFVSGFTTVFVALWASVGLVGYLLRDYAGMLRIGGGIVLILFGLHTAGLLEISTLYREMRLPLRWVHKPATTAVKPRYGRSLLLGVVFAGGWTPCVGPILGGIIGLASASQSVATGTVLLIAYALGLGIPFILVAIGTNEVSRRLGWLKRHHIGVGMVTGAALAITGFLMITNLFGKLSGSLPVFGL